MKINIFEKYNPEIIILNNCKKVLCLIRKTYINYTEEEKVRQAFIYYLINEIKIPDYRIVLEKKVKSIDSINGRIDILIYDEDDKPFIIYECKKTDEYFTDEIWMQGFRYFTAFNSIGYLGYVIGDEVSFYGFHLINNEIEQFELTNHPTYNELLYGTEFEVFVDKQTNFERLDYSHPINPEILNEFYNTGVFGKKTDTKLIPFMINFYNWLFDISDVLISDDVKDIGLKYTKYGSAVSSFSAMDYRTFIIENNNDKHFFSLALTSMKSSENVEFGTGLIVGTENSNIKHSSLQLRIETSVILMKNYFEIWHNGSITIGKTGAAKRSELIDYIKMRKPTLIIDDLIYLGKFDENKEIKSNEIETREFLDNLFNYCLLRDEFREFKKQSTQLNSSQLN